MSAKELRARIERNMRRFNIPKGMDLPRGDQETERRRLVRDLVVAVDRMADHWSEADDAVRKRLWTNMHTANAAVAEAFEVYPLDAEVAE